MPIYQWRINKIDGIKQGGNLRISNDEVGVRWWFNDTPSRKELVNMQEVRKPKKPLIFYYGIVILGGCCRSWCLLPLDSICLRNWWNVPAGQTPWPLANDTSLACSAETQTQIDKQVVTLIKQQYHKAEKILENNRQKLDEIAQFLYEKETITGEEFMKILNQ